MRYIRFAILYSSIILSSLCATAASDVDSLATDTVRRDFLHRGLIGKIVNYFEESNKPKENKKFDISFIGGPHYSSDTKFGIGLVAAGVYRTDTVTAACLL